MTQRRIKFGKINFYPRSPCGERRQMPLTRFYPGIFLSTLSLRRATIISPHSAPDNGNFYPRSPCGERPWQRGSRITYVEFLSTLSLRRATHYDNYNLHCVEISIHALLAESDTPARISSRLPEISIHALLAESDRLGLLGWLRVLISIHALLAESDC